MERWERTVKFDASCVNLCDGIVDQCGKGFEVFRHGDGYSLYYTPLRAFMKSGVSRAECSFDDAHEPEILIMNEHAASVHQTRRCLTVFTSTRSVYQLSSYCFGRESHFLTRESW